MPILRTPRLELLPMTLEVVEAVFAGHRVRAEQAAGARIPERWPGRDLVERAFPASLRDIRANPGKRLWGDRLMIAAEGERRVVGSVIFHGMPDDGIAEVGYGVEESERGQGFATEATHACVEWALSEPGISAVRATTFPMNQPSLRVITKLSMQLVERREHEMLGELLIFERRRA